MQLLTSGQESCSPAKSNPAAREPCKREVLALFGMPVKLSAHTIALAFTIFGIAWVLISTMLLEQQHYTAEFHTTFHLVNGLLFVILTALLLYLLVHRYATDLFCSRKLVAQVFDASPSGIAVIRDQDQKILLTNQQFAALSGYAAETLPGRTDTDLHLWENSEE